MATTTEWKLLDDGRFVKQDPTWSRDPKLQFALLKWTEDGKDKFAVFVPSPHMRPIFWSRFDTEKEALSHLKRQVRRGRIEHNPDKSECSVCTWGRRNCTCERGFSVEILQKITYHVARKTKGHIAAGQRYKRTTVLGYYENGPRWLKSWREPVGVTEVK